MEHPAERAEEVIEAYEHNFVGRVGEAARSVASRYENTPGTEDSLISIRGPYLQALDVPNWSDQSWESFCSEAGVNPLVREAFSELGFRRLYDFQERSIETISQGHDTVVTAATGRGKTEAWLIPILDRILERKRQEDETSVKATLIYPTKALAQDQFKRLVQYLYAINKKWPSSEQITIGIYDGDTPTNVGSKAQGYLQSSFKYFECPGRNDDLEKCRHCGQGVRVHHGGQQYELQPEKRQCIDDVPLDFIKLTKHSILNEGVDILLTNPDTINLKLINVNANDEHESFIYDPEFLVFDEVHTYDGLFGSYTATLTKRLRALRNERGYDDLQVIASSATVDNDVELFQKVSGAPTVEHVPERPRTLEPSAVDALPSAFLTEDVTNETLLEFAHGGPAPALLSNLSFDVEPEAHDNERLEELLQDALFDYFTAGAQSDPIVNTVQNLHQELVDDPRPRHEFLESIADRYNLEESEAETVLDNFQTVGIFSGLLENRTHLFSWPIDGFYACAACDAVYRSPQDSCTACEHEFVTRAAYCRGCNDEALVAWYCPDCNQLEPYIPTDEGDVAIEDEHYCQRCRQTRAEDVRSLRVTFHPTLECTSCGTRSKRSTVEPCEACGTNMVHTDPDVLSCPNPSCEETRSYESGCPDCGERQRPVAGDSYVDCSDCGETHKIGRNAEPCTCGNSLAQTQYIPWVCRNEECDRQYFGDPPDTCECGSSYTFARTGLFEVFEDQYCEACDTSFVGDPTCDCAERHSRRREGAHQSYKTFDRNGKIRTASSFRAAVPCTHKSLRYDSNRRYDELVRGPGNLAVTTSQYLLRRVADDEGYESAKMLSFADSHRDMKELDRDFTEPEVGTLLDQSLLEELREMETAWVPFDDVLDGAMDRIDTLHDELSPPKDVQNLSFKLKAELVDSARRHMDVENAIRDRLRRRGIPHRYSPRYREYGGSLAEEGLVDVRLSPVLYESLDEPARSVLRELVKAGNDCSIDDVQKADPATDITAIVDRLVEDDVLIRTDEYVAFSPVALEVTVAGHGDGLRYTPGSGTIDHTLDSQFGTRTNSSVPFETDLTELANPDHALFTARAYRALYSETRILVSRVYHGMTDKRERRELEYLFREGNYPHFLSSGPTMELGVDIGALDALLLYGTPPNMNAYLQRIGRAGRSSNSSLVHSVSQRNPIDYYYYDQPEDLMAADPQPVPLKEYNREVLRVSFTWAIFDYIAANFVVPWDVEQHGQYKTVSGGDEFEQQVPTSDDDGAKLTHVMSARTKELGLDTDQSKFAVLGTIVYDYRNEIESHLKSMLDHRFCIDCSRKYERESEYSQCQTDGCNGRLVDALAEFGELAEEAVENFEDRYIHSYTDYRAELEDELERVSRETRRVQRNRRRVASGDEARRVLEERQTLLDRQTALKDRLRRIESLSYGDFLRESRQSRYAFDMRTVSDNVGMMLVDSDGDEYTSRSIGDDRGRSMRMAISELHPGAAYLDGGDAYVVSRLLVNDFGSSELRERVRATDAPELAEQYRCPACRTAFDAPSAHCDCDSDVSLVRQRLVSPAGVTAHRSDLLMTANGDPARAVYENTQNEVQNTYAERNTDILSFDPESTFEVQTEGGVLGTVQYGTFTVLLHSSEYRAKYKNGEVDGQSTLFEVCGADDCTGIVYNNNDRAHCSANAEHNPRGNEGSEFVRLGYSYETTGVRVDLHDSEQSHTLVHGFRLALQYLGGVSIRELTEVVHDGEKTAVDLFDSQEGGADVARLLVAEGGERHENFQTAVDLLTDHFHCDCDTGCPLCLYQYGCDTRNRDDTFDRDSILTTLTESPVELVERDTQSSGNRT
ncbi:MULTISPECIES: DEAD/DEAH box helicase [Natrialbaceae]|uniref:DEAD/DEAH box helicase n=1 Tax=Natrialbaceae TaxID=1644061 RepID=UPI00207D491D|nr:DEAD/DEAH box helicase [Natronococcus sp. CG52]